jgi:hypothetical protein
MGVMTPAVDQPRVVEVRAARRASERPLPRTSQERVTHEPAREVELRLSPAPTPARMMNILEAEGGTKITAPSGGPPRRGVQPGWLMKILEAERWLKGTNSHGVAFLQR